MACSFRNAASHRCAPVKAGSQHDFGLIAEEVGEVVPEVVAYEENGVDAKSVDYARLTAVLIEAVKEQQAQIRQLQSEMDGLKARLGVEVSQSESPFDYAQGHEPVEWRQ